MQPSAIQSLPCLLTVGVTENPVGMSSSGVFLFTPAATQPSPWAHYRICGENTLQRAESVDAARKTAQSSQIASASAPKHPSRAVFLQMRQLEQE